jgi:hypothetical protein
VGTWLYRVVLNHCLSLKQRLLRFARPAPPRTQSAASSPEGAASLKQALPSCRPDNGPWRVCSWKPSLGRRTLRRWWT